MSKKNKDCTKVEVCVNRHSGFCNDSISSIMLDRALVLLKTKKGFEKKEKSLREKYRIVKLDNQCDVYAIQKKKSGFWHFCLWDDSSILLTIKSRLVFSKFIKVDGYYTVNTYKSYQEAVDSLNANVLLSLLHRNSRIDTYAEIYSFDVPILMLITMIFFFII